MPPYKKVRFPGMAGKPGFTSKGYYKKKGPARKTVRFRRKRKISIGYRGVPNTYKFIRETRPITIDIGNAATAGVSIVAGTGTIPSISIFSFPDFSIDQLAGGFTEFSALFANYKIDKIETFLIPQWSASTQPPLTPTPAWVATAPVPNLMVTRINTKYLPNGYVVPGTAEANRDQLAQIQKKSRSLYGTKKWLKIVTAQPRVFDEILDSRAGVSDNLVTKKSPWLPSVQAADQEYAMNDLMFCDRLDGSDFVAGLHLYRMYHRVHFRTSFVG